MSTAKNPLLVFSDEIRELIELECSDVYSKNVDSVDVSSLYKRAVKVHKDLNLFEFETIVSAYLKYKNKDVKNTALTRLLDKIEEIKEIYVTDDDLGNNMKRRKLILREIQTFVTPNDKEELLELIYYIKPFLKLGNMNSPTLDDKAIAKAYKRRFKDIREYVNNRFPNDPDFAAAFYVKPPFIVRLFRKIFGKK